MPMPHTVPLNADETALSFTSRLALVNKLPSLREFLTDFGFTITEVVHGDAAALTSLAELGAVDKQQLTDQAFRSCVGASCQILGFEIDKKYLLLGRNRICPACLRADMGSAVSDETGSKAYARIL